MNLFWLTILKIALPKFMELIAEAMQESSREPDNTIDDFDVGKMLANKNHLENKIKVNLKSKGGNRLFKRFR